MQAAGLALVCAALCTIMVSPSHSSASTSSDHDQFSLTPIRAHYLKKSLLQLQFAQEIQAVTSTSSVNSNASTLSYLGSPFSPPPRDAPFIDLPFLRYLFRQFVLTFPFLVSAPKDFFPDKVQPFISSLLSRNLYSNSILDEDESPDPTGKNKLVAKAERSFALFLNYATKIVEKEETVRLSQSDLDRLESIARRRHAKLMKNKDVFDVNIVCIRTVIDRGRVRSKAHEVRSHDTWTLFRSQCAGYVGIYYSNPAFPLQRRVCVAQIWGLQDVV
jgi:PX-associated